MKIYDYEQQNMENDCHVSRHLDKSLYEDLWRYANSNVDQRSLCGRGQKTSFEYQYRYSNAERDWTLLKSDRPVLVVMK